MEEIWNDDWREELKLDMYNIWERLAECRNTKDDILVISKLMFKYNKNKSKEQCLDRTLEWITDWNSQWNLYPDMPGEYNKILNKM